MENVREHFDGEASYFDQEIGKYIPFYENMVRSLLSCLPFKKEDPISIIDLGTGTGTIAVLAKEAYPKATITCVDLAKNMISEAKKKLDEYSEDISFHHSDFYDYQFDKQYHVALSSLALHHLYTDTDKKWFFQKIYDALLFDGMFVNADIVIGSGPETQRMYMTKWKEHLRKSFDEEQIEKEVMALYYDEDRPAPLVDQLDWLREIGFREVDVYWKHFNFAVYGGMKK